MIRPLTCLCMLLAGGSGLYLYQEKHRTSLLDREITRTIRASEAAHERTGLLRAEWALLNEPGRLQDLADRFLALHAMSPSQFVPVAELAQHLPAPLAPSASDATDGDGAVVADARPAPAQPVDPASPRPDGVRAVPPRAGSAVLAASGDVARADPAPRPASPAGHGGVTAAGVEARAGGASQHPARVVQADARQDRHSEPGAVTLAPAAAPSRSYAAATGGFGGGYAGGRVTVPVMSALASPVARPQRAEPLVTQAAAMMPVRPTSVPLAHAPAVYASSGYAAPGAAAPGPYSGSSLGSGRASLPPPVPMGAGAQ